MSKLVGTWELVDSENWDEYMKELGVGFVTRKAAAAIKPKVVIANNGNSWTLKLESSLKSSEINPTEDVEFNETTLDGKECRSVIRRETPDRIVQDQRDSSGKLRTTIVREVIGDQMVQTLTAGSVVCKRVYKRAA